MKVVIPRQIKMASHTYGIELNRVKCSGAGTIGLCNHLEQKIYIDDISAKSQLDQALLHEIMHMIERFFVVRIDDNDIDRIAEGLAILLFDNFGIEFDWGLVKDTKIIGETEKYNFDMTPEHIKRLEE